jgi:hypothetical protein
MQLKPDRIDNRIQLQHLMHLRVVSGNILDTLQHCQHKKEKICNR